MGRRIQKNYGDQAVKNGDVVFVNIFILEIMILVRNVERIEL